jgi:hypothetical protein
VTCCTISCLFSDARATTPLLSQHISTQDRVPRIHTGRTKCLYLAQGRSAGVRTQSRPLDVYAFARPERIDGRDPDSSAAPVSNSLHEYEPLEPLAAYGGLESSWYGGLESSWITSLSPTTAPRS